MTGRLTVHVHPGAKREAVGRWRADGALKLEVTARPEAGLANAGVIALLAETLGVKKDRISIGRGTASRSKSIEVEGMSDVEIRERIEAAMKRSEVRRGR